MLHTISGFYKLVSDALIPLAAKNFKKIPLNNCFATIGRASNKVEIAECERVFSY